MATRLDLPAEWAGQSQEEEGPRLLQQERATSAVRPESMASYIYGGKGAVARRLRAYAWIESDPVFSNADRPYLSQQQKYLRASQKAAHLVKKGQALGMTYEEIAATFDYVLDEVSPIDVHMKMVVPSLKHQTSPEQRDRWLPLAQRFEITGAYAQTELGHGSNVQVQGGKWRSGFAADAWVPLHKLARSRLIHIHPFIHLFIHPPIPPCRASRRRPSTTPQRRPSCCTRRISPR